MKQPGACKPRGVSLIEALVALAVLAFGLLGLVGVQTTLRQNADVARQRAEAVRIAQDAIEEWRGFSILEAAEDLDRMAYATVASVTKPPIQGINATYTLTARVNEVAAVEGTLPPRKKHVVVDVQWVDRGNEPQSVRLMTAIAGIAPAFSGSLALTGRQQPVEPLARHRAIPLPAFNFRDGTSGFIPPGQPGPTRVAWLIDNNTAEVALCTTAVVSTEALSVRADLAGCTGRALLLTGYVRFVTGSAAPPDAAALANPAGPQFPTFGLQVRRSDAALFACFQAPREDSQVNYFCAVPITSADPRWSGSVEFLAPLPLSASVADATPTNFKTCRYFETHPYVDVNGPLTNQNFAIIKATGAGGPYACPTTGTPRSWPHQPAA